jgi:serine/threonine protein kinase
MTDMTGSVPYMAPEVIVGGKYGRRVDVFAWAIIAYELFMKCTVAAKHQLDEQQRSENYLAWVSDPQRKYRNKIPEVRACDARFEHSSRAGCGSGGATLRLDFFELTMILNPPFVHSRGRSRCGSLSKMPGGTTRSRGQPAGSCANASS